MIVKRIHLSTENLEFAPGVLSGVSSDYSCSPEELGTEYIVYGLHFGRGGGYYTIDNCGYLLDVPIPLFEIIEPTVSKYWIPSFDSRVGFVLMPDSIREIDTWALADGEPEAVEAYELVKTTMDKEVMEVLVKNLVAVLSSENTGVDSIINATRGILKRFELVNLDLSAFVSEKARALISDNIIINLPYDLFMILEQMRVEMRMTGSDLQEAEHLKSTPQQLLKRLDEIEIDQG